MTKKTARLIRAIKMRCSYRYLAEVYYGDYLGNKITQLDGEELVREAIDVLYPDRDLWAGCQPQFKNAKDKYKFNTLNKRPGSDTYWWE